jgi:hypothetical protein
MLIVSHLKMNCLLRIRFQRKCVNKAFCLEDRQHFNTNERWKRRNLWPYKWVQHQDIDQFTLWYMRDKF